MKTLIRILKYTAILTILAFVGVAVLILVTTNPEGERKLVCQSRVAMIAHGLQNYHAACGCFPPAYTVDPSGARMQSWRVLLLPFLEGSLRGEERPFYKLYTRFRLDEPWNSPHNLAVSRETPDVYQCPGDPGADRGATSYLMLVGPEAISDGPTARSLSTVKDNPWSTLIVVESAGSKIHWSEPRDLETKEMSYIVNDPVGPAIRGHPGGAYVIFAIGAVAYLRDDNSSELIKAATTIAGGEHVMEDWGRLSWSRGSESHGRE